MTPPQPDQVEQVERQPFDVEIAEAIADRCHDIFLRYPEVKAIAASIVWNGGLNDAAINHHVWLGPKGPVNTIDGIIASVYQTLKLLDEQMGRGMLFSNQLRDQLTALGQEAVKANEELQRIRQAQAEAVQAQEARSGYAPAGAP